LPERNSYRRSLINLQADRRDLLEFQDSIRADLRDSLRDLTLAEESYKIQERSLALNERRAKSAKMNLEAGRLRTDLFLDAQRDLTAARNATDAARVDFTVARLLLFQQLELLDIDEQGLVIDWASITAEADTNDSVETENEDGE
jgi:outer membrane protein TolC